MGGIQANAVYALLGFLFGFLIQKFLSAYLSKKGENLATREDIQQITMKIEKVKQEVMLQSKIASQKYRLKYSACLDALILIDEMYLISAKEKIEEVHGRLGHDLPKYKNVGELSILARKCHNRLVLACDNKETIELFRLLIGSHRQEGWISADKIVDFRAAIRKELGFAGEIVDSDRENAWIGTVYPPQWTFKENEEKKSS